MMDRYRWSTTVVFVLLASVSLGANCNPELRACEYNDGVHECGYRVPSATTVVPACLNFCAPIPIDDPMTSVDEREGARCVVDPCRDDLWGMTNVYLCPNRWACDPDSASPLSDYGTCVRNGRTFGSGCDPSDRFETPCEGNTFCRALEGCPSLPSGIGTTEPGVCFMYRREGNECDGNWDAASTCLPCAPGLDCKDRGDGNGARCHRPCPLGVDQCPCDTETTEFSCGEDEYCNFCWATGAPECDLEVAECCDELATCDNHPGDSIADDVCCRADDVECDVEAEGQCCGGLVCDPATDTCEGCQELGELYDEEHPLGCCPELEARESSEFEDIRCLPPCDPNEECGRCNHNDSLYSDDIIKYTCHDDGPPTCDMPAEAPGADGADDDCDGYDDDCDGTFDEEFDEGGSCTGALQNGHCSGTSSWPGTLRCDSDAPTHDPDGGDDGHGWICEHVPGRDYCATNYTGDPPTVESAYVGESPSWLPLSGPTSGCDSGPGNCVDNSDCSPNRFCGYWNTDTYTTCITKHPSTFSGYVTDCGEMCWAPTDDNSSLVNMCP